MRSLGAVVIATTKVTKKKNFVLLISFMWCLDANKLQQAGGIINSRSVLNGGRTSVLHRISD
jgi:hypothetical protein